MKFTRWINSAIRAFTTAFRQWRTRTWNRFRCKHLGFDPFKDQ